eukprot:gnl/Trimastix_PCT/2741.p2 GENE.gnl/Trimastix_PCT/2741~~gnl/Trimastix_PCT/2741.p2  ORF type:complete len:134 (-),score=34.26 gnl/Trimastix_PCT/2741:323-724(-)
MIADNPDEATITLDDEHKIRILSTENSKEAQQLVDQCQSFSKKLDFFYTSSAAYCEAVEALAQRIDEEKLKAIGQRNNHSMEGTLRDRKKAELEALIAERRAELERYTAEYESLVKVEQEQQALITRLTSMEA